MMMAGPFEVLLILLLSCSPQGELPPDALAVLEPAVALDQMGFDTKPATIEKLIKASNDAAPVNETAGELSKDLESAIQNLASRNEKIRAGARKKLVEAGPKVRTRLEAIVAEDARRAEQAKKVLEALASREKAGGHLTELARTAAIRYAAAQKMTAQIPAITAAAQSDRPLVRMAAEDALVKLGARPEAEAAAAERPNLLRREIHALPKETRVLVVSHLAIPGPGKGTWLTMSGYFEKMLVSLKDLPGGEVPTEQFEEAKREGQEGLFSFVRDYGNLRPESAAVVNVGSVDEEGGGLGILLYGHYQPEIIRSTLSAQSSGWKTSEIAGVEVWEAPFMRLVLLGERSVLILPAEASLRFPLEEYLKNYAAEKNALAENARFAKFLATLDQPFNLRGLAVTDESLMSALNTEIENDAPAEVSDAVKGMQELELTARRQKDGKTAVRLEGLFGDKKQSKALSDFFRQGLDAQIAQMEEFAEMVNLPTFKTMLTLMKSIQISAEGKRGILRVEVPGLSLSELLTGVVGGG